MAVSKRHPGIPRWVWWAAKRTLFEHGSAATLERLMALNVDTLIVTSPADLRPISLGAEGVVERLRRSPIFHLTTVAELDHSSWVMRQRRLLIDVLDEHLASTFGRPRSTGVRSGDRQSGLDQPD